MTLFLALLGASAARAQSYDLESLMRGSTRTPAPPALSRQLAADPEHRSALARCVADPSVGLRRAEAFFAALPMPRLAPSGAAWLVVPTRRCPAYFGGHSVPFWIVERRPDGVYSELMSGAEDGLEVPGSRTLGYADLRTRYGPRGRTLYRFDGAIYQPQAAERH
ncbi:hypothetical protein [Cyanobium sp. ATX 6F1]|uniref:hypothetical protein n=1 Tax=unclassified Cyanobium TaxID=2627006 RepID=UPI0020CE7480|nr:hypothetical protein [Cyanobium sp. ATX 6F1]MCP9917644.1 hypothetical protein [Cyanobium sp. ATX 6F1]